jgi:hypothetical protein
MKGAALAAAVSDAVNASESAQRWKTDPIVMLVSLFL